MELEDVMEFDYTYRDHYQSYLKLGLIPYPASKSGKNPIVQWKDDLPNPISHDYTFWEQEYPNANIWVKLGKKFAVIDPDGPEAEKFVGGLNLPRCPTSISGNKSIHRWFKLSEPLKSLKAKVESSYLEVRTGEMGMLVAPSIHPKTHRPYKWKEKLSPWEIPFPELPIQIYEKIKALLPKPKFNPESETSRILRQGSRSYLDVEAYLNYYGLRYRVKQDAQRTIYLLEHCLFADDHTTKDIPGDSSIIQGADGKLTYQCFHNHCAFKTWADARRMISGGDSLVRFYPGLDIGKNFIERSSRPSLSLMKILMRG